METRSAAERIVEAGWWVYGGLIGYTFLCTNEWGFPGGSVLKNLPAMQEMQARFLEDPLEEEMATHSCILAWEIPPTEGPGGLQSIGSPRVGHD